MIESTPTTVLQMDWDEMVIVMMMMMMVKPSGCSVVAVKSLD
jgi:hypothetical protein